MTPVSSVESLFLAALEKATPAERSAFLDEACGGDADLRRRVQRLLDAQQNVGSFLQAPAASLLLTADPGIRDLSSTVVGPYKLLQQIGEGGMGLVYMAEQLEPVRRKVALKIIKPGMDSNQVMARFEAERQALAMMDHLNIAKVLEASTTDTGRPYFVMELVHGVSITKYCDDNKLTPRLRLELFIPVCQAVQHAHQKGIIHRDIKPSNVMVTMYDDKPVPKIIDFGVAKAIEQRLTEKTLFTHYGALVGTFEYMSPEQADLNAFGVDTRSDIYSLGVLLYELLTGTTPLERQRLRKTDYGEIVRLIKEEEAMRPSLRLSSSRERLGDISRERGTEATKLPKLVRGDLDWIVMRCLEKDRARRYETATGLAQDIRHYLAEEPVLACPPSTWYRFRKMARRNRAAMTTAAMVAAVLLLGIAVSTWQAVRASQAESVANDNAESAQQKEREAIEKRDEVQALNEKLKATQAQLRNTLYAAHLNLAQQAWDAGNVERVQELLEQHRPRPKVTDLRGFEWDYFNRLCHPEVLLIKPDGSPSGIAYSPDGMRLAAGLKDNRAKVWDARTGKELLTLKGHTLPITHTTFSPDGQLLATASFDNTVKVWDAQTGEELLTLTGPGAPVKLIEGDDPKKVNMDEFWRPQRGDFLPRRQGDPKKVIMGELWYGSYFKSLAFSPDSKYLAGACENLGAIVWNARTGKEITRLKGLAGSVSFSPDGERLAGPCDDRRVKVFDLQTGKQLISTEKQRAFGWYGQVIFSPDGKKLAAIGPTSVKMAEFGPWILKMRNILKPGPDEVNVWDAATGKELLTLKGHSDLVKCIAFSPDSQRLASASSDKTVKVWDANSGQELFTLKGHTIGVWDVAFRPDGKQLVTLGMDETIRVWDLQPLAIAAGTREVADISFSPDGKRVATAVRGVDKPYTNDVKVWNAQTGQQLLALKGLDGPTDPIRVVFSPDGKRLAGAVADRAKIWDAQTGQELTSIEDPRIGPGAAFSPDGKTLALEVVARDAITGGVLNGKGPFAVVALWDAQTGKELRSFKAMGHVGVQPVAFSPDGKRLYGQADGVLYPGAVIAWDVRTGEKLLHIKAAVPPLALSPDGTHLAGMDPNNAVKMWDAHTGKEILTLKGWKQPVTSIVFSPDGQRLVAASGAVIKLWNARTGEELLTLQGQGPAAPSPVGSLLTPLGPVAFSPDGHRLFGLGPDGMVKIWDATPLSENR